MINVTSNKFRSIVGRWSVKNGVGHDLRAAVHGRRMLIMEYITETGKRLYLCEQSRWALQVSTLLYVATNISPIRIRMKTSVSRWRRYNLS